MPRRLGEWTVAMVVALAVHGGVLAAITDWSGEQAQRERSAGRESVVWGVPMSAAAEAVEGDEAVEETVAPDIAEPVEASPPTAPAKAETSEPQPAEEQAETQPAETLAETQPAEEQTETPTAAAVEGDTSDRAVADAVPEAEASPEAPSETEVSPETEVSADTPSEAEAVEPVRTARAADPAEADIVEPAEEPVARPKRKPQDLAEKAAAKRRAEEARRAKSRERSASANAAAGQAKGSGGKREADGGRADASDFAGRVLAHLHRYKRYPSAAARRRLSGVVTVRFSIGKAGDLRAVALAGGSGAPLLDDAAVAMVRRASPFPAIPDGLQRNSMSFTVPVRYRPR